MKFPKLKGKFILAPMAGVTDVAFRELCSKYGAAMTFTELVSSEALHRDIPEVKSKIQRSKKEKVFGIQVFGSDAESIKKAIKQVQDSCDVIDLNLGCPAWCVVRQGSGSSLLKDPQKIKKIIQEAMKVLKNPLTIKIRSGFSKLNFLEIAKIAESLGVAAITLHPRTTKQGFSGQADWSQIRQLKESVSIPVIGNGDVFTPEDAVRMLKETNCEYIMIGRSARNNPCIFKQANDLLEKGKYGSISKVKLFLDYVKLAKKYKVDFNRIKQHSISIVSGFKGVKEFRIKAVKAESVEGILKLLNF